MHAIAFIKEHASDRELSAMWATNMDGYPQKLLNYILPFERRCAMTHDINEKDLYAHLAASLTVYNFMQMEGIYVLNEKFKTAYFVAYNGYKKGTSMSPL
jgi:hypothetical protein